MSKKVIAGALLQIIVGILSIVAAVLYGKGMLGTGILPCVIAIIACFILANINMYFIFMEVGTKIKNI